MATYKTTDLLAVLAQILDDGNPTVNISQLEALDDIPESLHFESQDEDDDEFVTDYDTVYAIDSTDDIDMSLHFHPDDLCSHFFFTYNEIETIRAALNHSLEYIKEESVKPIYSKEDLQAMKYSSVRFRNLLAKVDRFFKKISPV